MLVQGRCQTWCGIVCDFNILDVYIWGLFAYCWNLSVIISNTVHVSLLRNSLFDVSVTGVS